MLTIIVRTILVYVIVTAAVRIMGKRQVSDMQASELVITFIISQVAALPLENTERPLLISLIPIMMIIAIELSVSMLMMKSRRFRSLLCGHPIVVIKDGKIIPSQLRRLRISYEDLYSLLREQELSDESTVRYGIIEPNGSLSILTDSKLSKNSISSEDLQDEINRLNEESNTQIYGTAQAKDFNFTDEATHDRNENEEKSDENTGTNKSIYSDLAED